MNDRYKNFLTDIIQEICEKKYSSTFDKNTDLWKGYNFAIYEVLSLIINQAEAFEVNRKEIGLDNINPEKDLLI